MKREKRVIEMIVTSKSNVSIEKNESYVTGYEIAKRVNKVLSDNNLKNIPIQMIYNYFNNDLIVTTVVNSQRVVLESTAEAWIEKYTSKRIMKSNKK